MTPLCPKGLTNPNLNDRLSGGPEGIDGFPSGHPNLNDVLKNVFKEVLIVKVVPATFRPEKVEDETFEDVKWLLSEGKFANMVTLAIGGVVFSFEDQFTHKNKGPREGDVVRRPPFLLNSEISLPSVVGISAFQEAMLWL